jgi:hypothetical protein
MIAMLTRRRWLGRVPQQQPHTDGDQCQRHDEDDAPDHGSSSRAVSMASVLLLKSSIQRHMLVAGSNRDSRQRSAVRSILQYLDALSTHVIVRGSSGGWVVMG